MRFPFLIPSPRFRRLFNTEAIPRPPYNIILAGSDQFSCATLDALHSAPKGLINHILVVTPPSSATGRGLKQIYRPSLRNLADKYALPNIYLSASEIKSWNPPAPFDSFSAANIFLTASFGYLIPNRLLSKFAPLNTLNVHPSLLPKYRGAAPIQHAIMNGDESTGVSVQELSVGKFDQGRILGSKSVAIPPHSTFGTLEPILATEGASLLISVLSNLAESQANAIHQDPKRASLAPKLYKGAARVDWTRSAQEIERRHRGISHQFPLWTTLPNDDDEMDPTTLQLTQVSLPSPTMSKTAPFKDSTIPGQLRYDSYTKSLLIRCGYGELRIDRLKVAGKKECDGREWWSNGFGSKLKGDNTVSGTEGEPVFI